MYINQKCTENLLQVKSWSSFERMDLYVFENLLETDQKSYLDTFNKINWYDLLYFFKYLWTLLMYKLKDW